MHLDLLIATGANLPIRKMRVIWTLADHLTFDQHIGAVYKSGPIKRRGTVDAVIWLYSAVTVHMRINDKKLLQEAIQAAKT